MKKRIVCFICIVLLVTTCCCFFSACNLNLSEEENIERITKKLNKLYFNKDGTPTDDAYFYCHDEDGNSVRCAVESFEVETLLAFDGTPRYFLVTYEPACIGVIPGIIMDTSYRLVSLDRKEYNPFEKYGIEKGNRYYIGPNGGFAAIVDGKMLGLDPVPATQNPSSYWENFVVKDELAYQYYTDEDVAEIVEKQKTMNSKSFERNYSSRL